MYGLGFGPSLAFGHTVIDLEAIGWQVNHGPRHESDVSILGHRPSIRTVPGSRIRFSSQRRAPARPVVLAAL